MEKSSTESTDFTVEAKSVQKIQGKIIFIMTQMELGGAQTVCVRLVTELCRRGYDAEVWFLCKKSEAFTDFPHQKLLFDHRPRSIWEYLKVLKILNREIRRVRPQVAFSFTHYANVMGQAVAAWQQVPVRIASQRNPAYSYPCVARWGDYWLGTLGAYQNNIMVSKAVRQSFSKHSRRYQQRAVVIPNGVPQARVSESREQIRRQWQLNANKPLLVNVGRLEQQKNHGFLLDAIRQVNDAHLVIAGEGWLRQEIEHKIQQFGLNDRVTLLGNISNTQVRELLSASDLYVFPSKFEGMSNALLEALATGIPILASDIEPNREVLIDDTGKTYGMLLAIEDSKRWTTEIDRVLHDSDKLAKLRQLSEQRAKHYSFSRMVDQFLHVAERCASGKPIRDGLI